MGAIRKFLSDTWHWIVAAVAGLFALFLLTRKDHKTPVSDEAEAERKKREEEYKREDDELVWLAEEEKKRIEEEAESEKSEAVEAVQAETEKVKDDPKKIGDYLRTTDEEMR